MKTIQLRRYQLAEGGYDAFLEWWAGLIVPIRLRMGYQLEFAYFVPESNEIVWAASVPGDRSEWDRVEAVYEANPERIEAFAKLAPGVILSKRLDFVAVPDLSGALVG